MITATTANDPALCGLVLAGGEGKRLRSLIARMRGDFLPKQFVSFFGGHSLLESTYSRAEQMIPPERIFTVVAKNHLQFAEVRRQLSARPSDTIVVQPQNRETGPGLLLPLIYLHKNYPESVVVVFPSDHFILEESSFMSYVAVAVGVVRRDPLRLILVAVEPSRSEPEYGYVLPGKEVNSLPSLGLRRVAGFVEKPAPDVAQELITNGALWNTMIMVFKAGALLELVKRICPSLHGASASLKGALGTPQEQTVLEGVYDRLPAVNFSKDILEVVASKYPTALSVLPVKGVSWCDWGSEERVMAALKKMGHKRSARASVIPAFPPA